MLKRLRPSAVLLYLAVLPWLPGMEYAENRAFAVFVFILLYFVATRSFYVKRAV